MFHAEEFSCLCWEEDSEHASLLEYSQAMVRGMEWKLKCQNISRT